MSDRRRSKPQTANTRFQLVIDGALLARVRELAAKERRTVSNMLVVLAEEAMTAREKEKGQPAPVLKAA